MPSKTCHGLSQEMATVLIQSAPSQATWKLLPRLAWWFAACPLAALLVVPARIHPLVLDSENGARLMGVHPRMSWYSNITNGGPWPRRCAVLLPPIGRWGRQWAGHDSMCQCGCGTFHMLMRPESSFRWTAPDTKQAPTDDATHDSDASRTTRWSGRQQPTPTPRHRHSRFYS